MSEERRARLWVQYADDIREFQRGHPGLWQEFREIEEDRTVDHEGRSRAGVSGGKGHRDAGRNPLDQGRRPPDPRHPGSGAQTAHEKRDKRADRYPVLGIGPALARWLTHEDQEAAMASYEQAGRTADPGEVLVVGTAAPGRISTPGAPGRGTEIFVTGAAAWG